MRADHHPGQAVSCFKSLAEKGDGEAETVASLLEAGAVPDSISDRLFGELMRLSAPHEFTAWVRDGHTMNQLKGLGEDAGMSEASCNARISGATALLHLVRAGFAPSPAQRSAIAERMSGILASERPFDYERPHISHGEALARSIFHDTLKAMPHLLDKGQCALVIEACRSCGGSLEFVRAWTERAAWQSDIAALMERELTRVLRESKEPSDRLEAHRLRGELGKMEKRLPAEQAAGKAGMPPKRVI